MSVLEYDKLFVYGVMLTILIFYCYIYVLLYDIVITLMLIIIIIGTQLLLSTHVQSHYCVILLA